MGDSLSELLLPAFFLFGLLAIGLARNQSRARRGFLSGYRGLGVVLSFSAVVLLFGTGLVLLFYPYLTVAAEAGYGVLKVAAGPMGPVLIRILRFLFAPRNWQKDPPASSSGGDMAVTGGSQDPGWWAGPLGEAVRYLLLFIAVLALLAFIGLLLWLLFRWLLSRTPARKSRSGAWSPFPVLMEIWRAILAFFMFVISGLGERRKGALQLYAALLGWGRRSGMPRSPSETPMEYGGRLMERFPDLKGEVAFIVDVFQQEVYGGKRVEGRMLDPARTAWSRLRSPLHWPGRFKAWFLDTASFR